MSSFVLPDHLRTWSKSAVEHLPGGLRRRLSKLGSGRSVTDRVILDRVLRVEGANHGAPEYDDAWLIGLISECERFLDIGCNVGFFSLACCVLRPEAEVLAVDGNPECAAVTAANLVRNGFGDRARAVAAFVSDAPGEVEFYAVGLGAAGSAISGLSPTAETLDAVHVVRADTLDAIVDRTGFAPDLIKVDVEGAERAVLAGATRTATEHHPRFMVEMHSGGDLTMAENATDTLGWCRDHGYDAWYLKTGEKLETPGTVAHRGRCHLLLQPSGSAFPSILEGIPQGAPIESVLERLSKQPHP